MASIVTVEPRRDHGTEVTRLFEAHADWLRGYCLRQLGSPADAEDAVQTTFLHVLRALARGVVPVCEEAWLTTIAKNACRTQRRTVARRGPLTTDVDLDSIEGRHVDDDDRELLIGLDHALASLPDTQREALVLRELRGMPSREIASRLALSTPATHALITRARRSLARALTVPRAAASLNFGWLLPKLLAPLRLVGGGGAAKIAAVGAAATLVTTGVAVERGGSSPPADGAPRAETVGHDRAPAAASGPRGLDARDVPFAAGRRIAPETTSSADAIGAVTPGSTPHTPVDEAPSGPTGAPVPPADDEGGQRGRQPPADSLPSPAIEPPQLPLEAPEPPLPPLPPLPPAPLPPLPEPPVETPSLPPVQPDLPLP
jgi:RNA polymerase sigma factor (sigma-70 family)